MRTDVAIESELRELFNEAGVDGFIHVRDLDSGAEVGWQQDSPVVLASVFKIGVLVELFRQADAGRISLTDEIRVPATRRTLGPTGLSVMKGDVTLCWRDLAQLMICVSDNTATDVIMERVGLAAIQRTLAEVGCAETILVGDCKMILDAFRDDLDLDLASAEAQLRIEEDQERLSRNRSLDPASTNRSTPRDTARLLELIWTDRAASREGCAGMREIMYTQVWPHRLKWAFDARTRIGAKTGTLIGLRNEAGVIEYPDGKCYAAAVFTRGHRYLWHQPEADRSIGAAAKLAIDHLRAQA